MVVTKEGNHILISLKDQKRLMLLDQQYPKFLGRGRFSRSDRQNQRENKDLDSGIDTESEDECYTANIDNKPDMKATSSMMISPRIQSKSSKLATLAMKLLWKSGSLRARI